MPNSIGSGRQPSVSSSSNSLPSNSDGRVTKSKRKHSSDSDQTGFTLARKNGAKQNKMYLSNRSLPIDPEVRYFFPGTPKPRPIMDRINSGQLKVLIKGGHVNSDEYTFPELREYSGLADYPYSKDVEKLPAGWRLETDLKEVKLDENIFTLKDGMIKTESGLYAYLFVKEENEGTREASTKTVLVFGGTTSGEVGGTFTQRSKANFRDTFKQWMANAKNALTGKKPVIYSEACRLTQLLKTCYPNLETAGHSLGGGMASYAAAMNGSITQPMACHGFCSAELGKELIKDIEEHAVKERMQSKEGENFQVLVSRIKHIHIKGDVVPNMHVIFSAVTNVGKIFKIDVGNDVNQFDKHDKFKDVIDNYIDKQSAIYGRGTKL